MEIQADEAMEAIVISMAWRRAWSWSKPRPFSHDYQFGDTYPVGPPKPYRVRHDSTPFMAPCPEPKMIRERVSAEAITCPLRYSAGWTATSGSRDRFRPITWYSKFVGERLVRYDYNQALLFQKPEMVICQL